MSRDPFVSPSGFNSAIEEFTRLIRTRRIATVFTGAGISTDSGIPDFRSHDGVWAKRAPVMFSDFMECEESRFEYWSQKAELHPQIREAEPNLAHKALAAWEKTGGLHGVITQNIDGLHQIAGSERVLELHGTARNVRCLDCGLVDDVEPYVEQYVRNQHVPLCPRCAGRLKHATVSFGQSLPEHVLTEAMEWATECELFVVFGSSLVVHPAAGLPELATRNGADLVIVNREPTPLDKMATVVINGSIGETVQRMNEIEAF
ncbi:UNVERIFIED_CONTAM: hypothetical protein GTU68_000884 [Idotea baltica]|nr:hypothetical protein [Idotea baltica]